MHKLAFVILFFMLLNPGCIDIEKNLKWDFMSKPNVEQNISYEIKENLSKEIKNAFYLCPSDFYVFKTKEIENNRAIQNTLKAFEMLSKSECEKTHVFTVQQFREFSYICFMNPKFEEMQICPCLWLSNRTIVLDVNKNKTPYDLIIVKMNGTNVDLEKAKKQGMKKCQERCKVFAKDLLFGINGTEIYQVCSCHSQ